MSVIWLTPLAWWGLLAVSVPIAVHLLTRQRERVQPFPTLRFLRATRLSALRYRLIDDWLLLVVRLAIVTAAVAALASPLFISMARQEEWRTRTVAAIVIPPGTEVDRAVHGNMIASEQRARFGSQVFAPRQRLADGVRDAVEWLSTQPPARREVVIAGDLREGQLSVTDLSLVPADTGIRFLPVPAANPVRTAGVYLQTSESRWRAEATFLDSATTVTYSTDASAAVEFVVRAAVSDQQSAQAALDAVLARGITVPGGVTRVVVVFEDAPSPEVTSDRSTRIVGVRRRAASVEYVHELARLLSEAFADDVFLKEPNPIAAAQLAAWSRPPAADNSAAPADQGDRRWLWASVLTLLVVEQLLRRQAADDADAAGVEKRVA
jgi:hypothetical protein